MFALLFRYRVSVAAEHAQLREEVKRLKNLKRKEIQDKARIGPLSKSKHAYLTHPNQL